MSDGVGVLNPLAAAAVDAPPPPAQPAPPSPTPSARLLDTLIVAALGPDAPTLPPPPTTPSSPAPPSPSPPSPPEAHVTCWERVASPRRAPMPLALAAERDALAAAAGVPYDPSNPAHTALMRAVYVRLTGRGFTPGDWEAVGFQRADSFESDLRAVGLLGPLCVAALAGAHPALAGHLFTLAGGARPPSPPAASLEWPLMAAALNVCLAVLGAMRGGALDGEIARRAAAADPAAALEGGVSEDPLRAHPAAAAFLEAFAALTHEFARAWAAERTRLGRRQQRRPRRGGEAADAEPPPPVAVALGAALRRLGEPARLTPAALSKTLRRFRKAMTRPPYGAASGGGAAGASTGAAAAPATGSAAAGAGAPGAPDSDA